MSPEQQEWRRAYGQAYSRSPAGRAAQARYRNSPKGRAKVAALDSAYQKKLRQRYPEKMKARAFTYQLRAMYGLELDDYLLMVLGQEGRCKICEVYMEYGTKSALQCNIDRCHATDRIRSLLCARCNTQVGRYETSDVPKIEAYLSEFRRYQSEHG